jgi:hypothetical protein
MQKEIFSIIVQTRSVFSSVMIFVLSDHKERGRKGLVPQGAPIAWTVLFEVCWSRSAGASAGSASRERGALSATVEGGRPRR